MRAAISGRRRRRQGVPWPARLGLLWTLCSCTLVVVVVRAETDTDRSLRPWRKISRIQKRETVVPDSYVVLLYDLQEMPDVLADHGVPRPSQVYRHVLQGFAVDHLSESVMWELAADPRVAEIAEDGLLDEEQAPPVLQTQSPAVWHLDRLDGTRDFEYHYRYDGSGVHVYILDSGVQATNVEFEDRLVVDCFDDVGPCNSDSSSHGTHVAGIVGGRQYGVAKGVTLHDVRIRDGDNMLRWAFLFAGMDHVIAEQQRYPDRHVIANLSYSGTWCVSCTGWDLVCLSLSPWL
jgi:hypothetical protein